MEGLINKHPGLRPRNVTATEEEKALLLTAAPPHMRLWILLCSDLAIRSGTSSRIAPQHYDPRRRTIQFTTKLGEKLTLPVTKEIGDLFDSCNLGNPQPFVRQLHHALHPEWTPQYNLDSKSGYAHTLGVAFIRLRRSLGITRKLTPHDFRRTTAVKLYEATGDARDVQSLLGHRTLASTIWYLDHDLRPVSRANLELIKNPEWRKELSA
jgi:integrase